MWTCPVDHRVDPQGRSTMGKMSPLWTCPVDHRVNPQGKSTMGKLSPLWTCTVDHRARPQGKSTMGKLSPLWTCTVDHRARPQGKSTVETSFPSPMLPHCSDRTFTSTVGNLHCGRAHCGLTLWIDPVIHRVSPQWRHLFLVPYHPIVPIGHLRPQWEISTVDLPCGFAL